MEHCQHCHGGCHSCGGGEEVVLSRAQAAFLSRFGPLPFLPLGRFLMDSSREEELESVGLAPVFFETGLESLEQVKETGALLTALEELGLVSLDYDLPLSNFDYGPWEESPLFARFRATVAEGAGRPGFLFDLPILEEGSMALTALGQAVLDQLEGLL